MQARVQPAQGFRVEDLNPKPETLNPHHLAAEVEGHFQGVDVQLKPW